MCWCVYWPQPSSQRLPGNKLQVLWYVKHDCDCLCVGVFTDHNTTQLSATAGEYTTSNVVLSVRARLMYLYVRYILSPCGILSPYVPFVSLYVKLVLCPGLLLTERYTSLVLCPGLLLTERYTSLVLCPGLLLTERYTSIVLCPGFLLV